MAQKRTGLSEVVRELATKGPLRIALNHGNVVLVRRGPTDDMPSGVSVDLARELASRLGVPPVFVHYQKAGDVSASAVADEWDVCFLAIDPLRADVIDFTEPYVAIEGNFLVPDSSLAVARADVDRLALKIGVTKGSAYELHLSRASGSAEIVRNDTAEEAAAGMLANAVDGLAGVRQAMEIFAAAHAGFRVIPEPFMSIRQAMGVKAGKPLAKAYVRAFIEEMKASGFVADALSRGGHGELKVP